MNMYSPIISAMEAMARSAGPSAKSPASEQYWHMGIDTPIVRKLARRFSKPFCALSCREKANLVHRLLDYGSDEAAHLGVFLLGLSPAALKSVDVEVLDTMVGAFRGWSVTDAFCVEVLQPLLLRFTSDVLSLIAGWATAESRWKRRASVVIFVRKVGASGDYTQHGLSACERLIADNDDLVRKGVGWALKDLMRGDRETVLEYVEGLRRRGVTAVITLYALRDIRGAERQRVLAIKP